MKVCYVFSVRESNVSSNENISIFNLKCKINSLDVSAKKNSLFVDCLRFTYKL